MIQQCSQMDWCHAVTMDWCLTTAVEASGHALVLVASVAMPAQGVEDVASAATASQQVVQPSATHARQTRLPAVGYADGR
jgi:hypothetical protein